MLVSLDNVSRSFGDQEVLEGVSAVVHEQDRIGLIGPNGTGKSTLLSVLLGELEADSGSVFRRADARVGYLAQGTGLEADSTVMEEMRSVFSGTLAAEARLRELSEQMEKNPEDIAAQRRYDAAMSEFLAGDGYTTDVRIRKVLAGMGFGTDSEETVISTMSGGEKTRLALAKLLLQEPDFLVLDEPTNHLDMDTLSWLETYLTEYKGALLVVSHDRFFLDRVAGKIWDLEDGVLETYKGNYTAFRTQKKERTAKRLREWEKQQEQIRSLTEYVDKNITRASTSNMAKSRQKTLGKMEVVKKPRTRTLTPHFSFEAARKPWSEVLSVHDLDLQVGEEKRTIAENVEFEVMRGERLAVLGANGTGKTTLLRRLLDADGKESKEVSWGRGVEIGYYDQENRDLKMSATAVSEVMRKVPGMTEGQARSLLGRVLLQGDDAFKAVGLLSGGERAKLGLAILMARNANTLLLDEPTNHLDLEAREALEEALRAFDGTLVFVSHDRYFVNALAGKVLAIEEGTAHNIQGNYDAYAEVRRELREQAKSSVELPGGTSKAKSQKELRRMQAERRQNLYAVEQRLASLESEEKELRALIESSPADYEALQEACTRLETVTAETETLMEEWLLLSEEA